MIGQSYLLVVKATVNIGDLPYLQKINEQGERPVKYHHDNWVENFPRVLSLTRVEDVLEINLFLEHRYKGVLCRQSEVADKILMVESLY